MTRLAISVEGPTERNFVNEVLADHLNQIGVYPTPISLDGNVRVETLVSEMVEFSWRFDAVTSFVDLYGFRNRQGRSAEGLEKDLTRELDRKNLDTRRVFPYVQKYEFEGLLFSDTSAFQVIADVNEGDVAALSQIRGQFPSPEDINDGHESAPSKRIMGIVGKYNKAIYGWSIAQEIGLAKIREECPRFGAWLTRLEELGS